MTPQAYVSMSSRIEPPPPMPAQAAPENENCEGAKTILSTLAHAMFPGVAAMMEMAGMANRANETGFVPRGDFLGVNVDPAAQVDPRAGFMPGGRSWSRDVPAASSAPTPQAATSPQPRSSSPEDGWGF